MSTTYEQWALARYISRLAARVELNSPAGESLDRWCGHYRRLLGLPAKPVAAKTKSGKSGTKAKAGLSEEEASVARWNQTRAALCEAVCAEAPPRGIMEANLGAMAEAFGLSELEREILLFLLFYDQGCGFESLCDGLVTTRAFNSDAILAIALGVDMATLRQAVNRGPLRRNGLISGSNRSKFGSFGYSICGRLADALAPPHEDMAAVEKALLGDPIQTTLDLAAFDHVARARDFIIGILRAAAAGGETGVNILVYGEVGTGKTAFCGALARQVDCTLFGPSGTSGEAGEPDRQERLEDLCLVQKIAARRPRSILLFDEMEDLLGSGVGGAAWGEHYRRVGSKLFLNTILETNPVPVLWTTNDVGAFDPALLRRMTFALEMKVPSKAVRRDALRRLSAHAGLKLEEAAVERLAGDLPVSPAIYAHAARAARLGGRGAEDFRFAAEGLAKAVRGGAPLPPSQVLPAHYDPALIKTDIDLARLEARLAGRTTPPAVSFCFFGPPGTGKSAYVRHLAARLGLEVSHKRVSDLISMWLGESEKHIAEAFREARENDLFLIFDEADSLLAERAGAGHSWEVSQVNEMLTWMETHPLPFACTTNLLERLDRAALRRFTFKLRFDYLDAAQAARAYRLFFARPAPPALAAVPCLTPADFALTAKKLAALGSDTADGPSDREILTALEQEVALKPDLKRPIGFRA